MRSLLLVVLLAVSCLSRPTAADNIVETAVDAGSFETLVAAVKAAGLVETLSGPGPLTVFAPTDEAFANLPDGTLDELLKPENRDRLTAILTYHVVPGRVDAATVSGLSNATTVNGQRVDVSADDGVMIDGAKVVQADIDCDNGIIHVIDEVLLPEERTLDEVAADAGSFGTLIAAANAAGLVDTLRGDGPLTVFAPTEDAFGALPKGTIDSLLQSENRSKLAEILKYHVVSGRVYSDQALKLSSAPTVQGGAVPITRTESGALVGDARLVDTDIEAANGVIHIIDRVLLPSSGASPGPPSTVTAARPAMGGREEAKRALRDAIQRGAPIYNAGDPGECARIYEETLGRIVDTPDIGLSDASRDRLRTTLRAVPQMASQSARAWALRGQIDRLLAEL